VAGRRLLATALAVVTLVLGPRAAGAVTRRYALVVGANHGAGPPGAALPDLRHAETEAELLRDELVELAGFDRSDDRTLLLLGATRASLRLAARRLAERKALDERRFGPADTLFGFFYTGHGLEARLLLADGPLTGRELGELFAAIGADLTLGVIDACFSASLDSEALTAKGIRPTPGVNLLRELPRQALSAEGTMLLVSSGPGEYSFEDPELGGVFTHFFIEALREAEPEGPGIPLEHVWSYARLRTVEHTAARGQRQTPTRFVRRLEERGRLYFSFPRTRSATLLLSESVAGRFSLAYEAGGMSEWIDKAPGASLAIAAYPGRALLSRVEEGRPVARRLVSLEPHGQVVVRGVVDAPPEAGPGWALRPLSRKGTEDGPLLGEEIEAALDAHLVLGYGRTESLHAALSPRDAASLRLRFDYGRYQAALRLGRGWDQRRRVGWGYRVRATAIALELGRAWDLGPVRASLAADVEGRLLLVDYDDGIERSTWSALPGVQAGALIALLGPLALQLSLAGGLQTVPADSYRAVRAWDPWVRGGAAVALHVW